MNELNSQEQNAPLGWDLHMLPDQKNKILCPLSFWQDN